VPVATLTQIHFTHVNGAEKAIPGLAASHSRPKLRRVYKDSAQLGKKIYVYEHIYDHVEKINLLPEDPNQVLNGAQEKLPENIQNMILKENAEKYLGNVRANSIIRNILRE
jgi:hypothetical protein